MVLLYDYCDISHVSCIINMFWEKDKYQELRKKNIFLEFINGKFCKHIIKKEKDIEKLCLNKNINSSGFCKKHTPKILIKCSGKNSKNGNCKRNVNKKGQLCIYCIKKNTKNYNCIINTNLFLIENSYKYNCKIVSYYNFENKLLKLLNKYKITFYILYILLILITGEMENKMQFYFFDIKNIAYKNDYVQPLFSDQNKQVILYEHKKYPDFIFNNNKDSSNIINLFDFKKTKKYKKNLKKRKRQKIKKQEEKEKPLLILKEKLINVKDLNNEELIENIDSGFMCINRWPLKYESYKDLTSYEILYFHNYYNKTNIDGKSVIIFYKEINKINHIKINYRYLYNLFIKEYNNKSVYNFIKKYYSEFNPKI